MDKLKVISTKKGIIKFVAILFAVVIGLTFIGGLNIVKYSGNEIVFGKIGNYEIFIVHEMSFLLLFLGTIVYLLGHNKGSKIILFIGTLLLFIYAVLSTQVNPSISIVDSITSSQMFVTGIETLFGGNVLNVSSINNIVTGLVCDIALMLGGVYMIESIPWKKYYPRKNK